MHNTGEHAAEGVKNVISSVARAVRSLCAERCYRNGDLAAERGGQREQRACKASIEAQTKPSITLHVQEDGVGSVIGANIGNPNLCTNEERCVSAET